MSPRPPPPRGGATFVARSRFPVPAEVLWAYHARPGAFERLAPPFDPVTVVAREGGLDGGTLTLRIAGPPGLRTWVAKMGDLEPGRAFADVQTSGPFRAWRHEHRVEPDGPDASVLTDTVRYELPLPPLGRWVAGGLVRRKLARLFRFRHARTGDDVVRHHADAAGPRLRVGVTGASGLVGSALVPFLTTAGHEVVPWVRDGARAGVRWDPERGPADVAAVAGLDALVHLAGAPLPARGGDAALAAALGARVRAAAALARALASASPRPRVLVVASGVGALGDRGDDPLDEDAPLGAGPLAAHAEALAAALEPARAAGVRVVTARLGLVLTAAGGALARWARPFRLGVGGPLGDGRAFVPWVALDDVVGALLHVVRTPALDGPVHVVAPTPARHADVARALGAVLRRPALVRVPRAVVRVVAGAGAAALVLASARVRPARLEATGFRWVRPDLEDALAHELGCAPRASLRPAAPGRNRPAGEGVPGRTR